MSTPKATQKRSTSRRFTLQDLGASDETFETYPTTLDDAQDRFNEAVSAFLSKHPVNVEVGSPFQEMLSAHRNLCEHFAEWSAKDAIREEFARGAQSN